LTNKKLSLDIVLTRPIKIKTSKTLGISENNYNFLIKNDKNLKELIKLYNKDNKIFS
jgi:hypothetical protein